MTTPSTLPVTGGLELWCRADKGIVLSNGAKISQWSDQSGNNHHLVQATDSARPTFLPSSARMGNGSSLLFSGAQKLICVGFDPMAQPNTTIVLGRFSSLTGNPGIIDNGIIRQIGYCASSGPSWAMTAQGATLTGGVADTNTHVFAFVFNSTTSKLYIDWADVANASGDAGAGSGTGGFILGAQSTGFMTGEIAEVIAYNRELSQGEVNALGAYFAIDLANGTRPCWQPPETLAVDGNSIFFGDFGIGTTATSLGFANRLAAFFPNANFINSAVEGYTTPQVISQSAAVTDPQFSSLRRRNVVIMGECINDYINNGHNVSTCVTNLVNYVAAKHAIGWKVILCTPTPATVFTDADRLSIRSQILAGVTGADVICDLGDPSTVMGNIATVTNPLYYKGGDQIHPTAFGHSLLLPPALKAVRSVW